MSALRVLPSTPNARHAPQMVALSALMAFFGMEAYVRPAQLSVKNALLIRTAYNVASDSWLKMGSVLGVELA